MESKSMTRKDFFVLTFSLVSSAVVATNCSSSNNGGGTGGSGAGGSGAGGKGGTGAGGSGAGGKGGSGAGGSGAGGSSAGGKDGGGDTADSGSNCDLPLDEQQIQFAGTDTQSHVHSVVVDATILNSTTNQTFQSGTTGGHTHSVTLTAANLTTLRGGGMVTVTAGVATLTDGGACNGHTHTYVVGCHAFPD